MSKGNARTPPFAYLAPTQSAGMVGNVIKKRFVRTALTLGVESEVLGTDASCHAHAHARTLKHFHYQFRPSWPSPSQQHLSSCQ